MTQLQNPLIVGQVINWLTVLEVGLYIEAGKNKKKIAAIKVQCRCGKIFITRLRPVIKGTTRSCRCYNGYLQSQRLKKLNTTHNLSSHLLYGIWCGIKYRCYNINAKEYKNYGARGIILCDEWKNNFQTFYDWAISNGYAEGLSIDRIDNNGNYHPDNCRWVNNTAQQRNKNNNRLITAFGETKCKADWIDDQRCVLTSVNTLTQRINRGMQPELAITTPPDHTRIGKNKLRRWSEDERTQLISEYNSNISLHDLSKIHSRSIEEIRKECRKLKLMPDVKQKTYYAFGQEKTFAQWARDSRNLASKTTLRGRIERGETMEQAMSRPTDMRFSR